MDEPRTEPPAPQPPAAPAGDPYTTPGPAAYPPPYAYAPASGYPPPYQQPPAPSRKGGWLAAILIGIFVLLFACVGLLALATVGDDGIGGSDAVAIIPIDGEIMGSMGAGLLGAAGVTPEDVIGKLRKAERDDSVKAILLRVDSPGGTASASEEIAMEVARIDKPVITSVGDVGASGAYMIASQTDRIVASPLSAVGSIGVILTIPNYEGLLDKVGVKYRVFTEGKYKDAGSPFRDLTPTETVMIQEDLEVAYDEFVDLVAKGRKLERSKVETLATGWVWSGRQAKTLGLVDELGNYSDAIRVAAERGGIDGEPRIVTYEETSLTELLESLPQALGGFAPAALRETREVPVAR